MFGMRSSTKVAAAGFLNFFVYKICEGFVEGNGNCLPNSIIKELDFKVDTGAELLYTQMYL